MCLADADRPQPTFHRPQQNATRTDSANRTALSGGCGREHPHVAEIVNNRGVCLYMLGDSSSAEVDFRRALEIYRAHFGTEHAKIAAIVNNLGYALVNSGQFNAAKQQFTAALKMAKSTLGKTHPTVAAVLRNLGKVCLAMQHPRDARTHYEEASAIDERVLGPDHPDTGNDVAGLAEAAEALKEFPKAKQLMYRAALIEEASPRPDQGRLASDSESSRDCTLSWAMTRKPADLPSSPTLPPKPPTRAASGTIWRRFHRSKCEGGTAGLTRSIRRSTLFNNLRNDRTVHFSGWVAG